MAAKKGSKKGAKKAAHKGPKKSRAKKGAHAKKGGKLKGHLTLTKVAEAVNRMETRVDTLEHNDAANQRLWLGMINEGRRRAGRKGISSLPGFAKPRLYSGGYGSRKSLGAGR